jgi:zinc protease
VSEAELAKAKRALEVGLIAGQGSSNALASRIAEDWTAFGRIRPLDERLAAIRAVGAADVQRVAQTWLVPEGRSVVQLLPPPAEQKAAANPAKAKR